MAVTESSLLANFLLPPAPLAISLSLQQFTELFPKSRQEDATIPSLYRELQKQRAQDIERVKQNIAAEIKHGELQQRHIRRIRRTRLRQELGGDTAELALEAKVRVFLYAKYSSDWPNQLYPEHVSEQQREAHTVESLIPEMEQASEDMEEEVAEMEKEAQIILADIQTTIGDLSDLRYGRFSKTPGATGCDLSTEVLESLRRIQQLCDDAGKGWKKFPRPWGSRLSWRLSLHENRDYPEQKQNEQQAPNTC
jgi:centromere-localized protein 2